MRKKRREKFPAFCVVFTIATITVGFMWAQTSVKVVKLKEEAPVFLYRMPITIGYFGKTPLTNYSIKLMIDTASLIKEGKMEPDCGDIRFTNETSFDSADWKTKYPYWIESGCNTNETVIWVKVDLIPAGANKTIYMYYDIQGYRNNPSKVLLEVRK